AIGYGLTGPCRAGAIGNGAPAMLTQEIRNPRAGTYTISVHVCGGGTKEDFRQFPTHFRCRLVLFGYKELTKDATKGRREYESVAFDVPFVETADGYQKVTLTRKLRSQDGGASEIEMGVGIAVIIEQSTGGKIGFFGRRAFVRVDDVEIDFVPRARNDEVTE